MPALVASVTTRTWANVSSFMAVGIMGKEPISLVSSARINRIVT
jgi:hypothetical protein